MILEEFQLGAYSESFDCLYSGRNHYLATQEPTFLPTILAFSRNLLASVGFADSARMLLSAGLSKWDCF